MIIMVPHMQIRELLYQITITQRTTLGYHRYFTYGLAEIIVMTQIRILQLCGADQMVIYGRVVLAAKYLHSL